MNILSTNQTPYTQSVAQTNAIRATSAYETVQPAIVEQTDKLTQMKEKYKYVYTPLPESYSIADEELQNKKIYEAYPDYVSFNDLLKNINDIYNDLGGEPIEIGIKTTQEQNDKQQEAYAIAMKQAGGEEHYFKMQEDVTKIQNLYPVNYFEKSGFSNGKELARFTNAAVYEGMEQGLSVDKAQGEARKLINQYMDSNYSFELQKEGFEKVFGINISNNLKNDTVESNSQGGTWNLSKYGINGKWEENKIYHNEQAMISELENKLQQFQFMLNNKGLIEEANESISIHSQKQINTYESKIIEDLIPQTQRILKVFQDYQIYDSINVKA